MRNSSSTISTRNSIAACTLWTREGNDDVASQPIAFECQRRLAAQIVLQAASKQRRAEAELRWRRDLRAARLLPVQPYGATRRIELPMDADAPARNRQRAVLDRVRAELVQRHRQRHGPTRFED